jgi:hypothetical protein
VSNAGIGDWRLLIADWREGRAPIADDCHSSIALAQLQIRHLAFGIPHFHRRRGV